MINITGGNDLTLFEVDQSVNKIRAEVDPEAELIFGAIKDESMTGKIRVSIVATALDGHKAENNTVLNMVSRIQNRNTGYSENLFSHNPKTENTTINSIYGATALKLDESYELHEEQQSSSITEFEKNSENEKLMSTSTEAKRDLDNIPTGVSIESASYIEKNNIEDDESNLAMEKDSNEEEYTPKLFSEEQSYQTEDYNLENSDQKNSENTEQLFNQDINEEEDFEIPAFLRKQKF